MVDFPGGSDGKASAYSAGDRVQSLGREDLLEKKMATHSSTLAWKIRWTEKPGRLQSMGSQRAGHDWATSLHFTSLHFIESEDYFVWYSHFDNINSSNPRTCSISPSVCVILISFNSVLEFSAYKSFVSLSRFIPQYFILSNAKINRIIFWISAFDLVLLVYTNATDFCVLILYPATLPN